MKQIIFILTLIVACNPPDSASEDRAACTKICFPNLPSRIERSLGKVTCECDVQSEAGIVKVSNSYIYNLCNGHAIRRSSVSSFGESVECAP